MELAKRLRGITQSDAIQSYQSLKETAGTTEARRAGLDALDYCFLGHRLKTKTRRHLSFVDAMKDPQKAKQLTQLVVQYKKKPLKEYDATHLLKAQYQVFQLYFGTVNQFRPLVAKWVYERLKPKVGILDFSMGWGGRLMAAMSMGIPYVGCDANTKLESAYEHMVETYEPKAKATLLFQPAETVSFQRYRYDLIFTSPPYFMIEKYEKMPAYRSKQDFLDTFLIPVVQAAWTHLQPGGNMVLNMPQEMMEAVQTSLPPLKDKWELPLSNRHPVNAVKKAVLGTEDKERHEWMYVWHKRGVTKRKTLKRTR